MAKNKKITILILLALALSCAKQEAPTGGPKDKQPPVIVETNPLNETVNFSGDRITAEFSEYIEKSSVRNSIFISPDIEKLKLEWSGKSLEIIFLDSLKPNTTYTVTFGTDIKDLNEKNKMSEAFTLVFSTGAKIDRGTISGSVFDRNPEGVMIFAYKLADSLRVNPAEQKPDYTTQCGKNGFYLLSGLAASRYELFAVRDENSDKLFSPGEQIGFTSVDVILQNDSAKLGNVNFMLASIDTTKPKLTEITMTDKNHFLLEYSESIDSARLESEEFSIIDSTENKAFPVKYVYKGKTRRGKILLSFSATLNKEHDLFLACGKVYDKAGNASDKSIRKIYYNEKPDTLAPKFLGIKPAYGEEKLNFMEPAFSLLFDDGITLTRQALDFIGEKNDTIDFAIRKINDAEFEILPKRKLKSNSSYAVKIDFSSLADAAGNSLDTVFSALISTYDEIDLVSVEGNVKSPDNENAVFVRLDNLKNALRLKTKATQNGNFKFEFVPPGNYYVWAFEDKNKNGEYDFGSLNPLKRSEKFAFRGDTLKIRPRWPVKNVNFEF